MEDDEIKNDGPLRNYKISEMIESYRDIIDKMIDSPIGGYDDFANKIDENQSLSLGDKMIILTSVIQNYDDIEEMLMTQLKHLKFHRDNIISVCQKLKME
jgi:hypothetical protein